MAVQTRTYSNWNDEIYQSWCLLMILAKLLNWTNNAKPSDVWLRKRNTTIQEWIGKRNLTSTVYFILVPIFIQQHRLTPCKAVELNGNSRFCMISRYFSSVASIAEKVIVQQNPSSPLSLDIINVSKVKHVQKG